MFRLEHDQKMRRIFQQSVECLPSPTPTSNNTSPPPFTSSSFRRLFHNSNCSSFGLIKDLCKNNRLQQEAIIIIITKYSRFGYLASYAFVLFSEISRRFVCSTSENRRRLRRWEYISFATRIRSHGILSVNLKCRRCRNVYQYSQG